MVARFRNGTASDLRSTGRGFDSRSDRYQGKTSRYNIQVNPAFHPSGIGKSNTGLPNWAGRVHLCRTVGWQLGR